MRALETFTAGGILRVDVGAIERALTQLWKDAAFSGEAEAGAVTRACLLNLVVWSPGGEAGRALPATISRVVAAHPSRVLLIEVEAGRPEDALEAFISAYCHRPAPGARQVCCEQVTLRASAGATRHLPGLLAGLLAADLPVCLYAPGDLPFDDPAFARAAAFSEKLIVDSATFSGAPILGRLAALAGSLDRAALGDLGWRRLRPFQDLVAGFFDAPLYRPVLPHLTGLATSGGAGTEAAARLLAGWAKAALEGRPLALAHQEEPGCPRGTLRSVRLRAPSGPAPADFLVEADPSTRILTARVESAGTCPLPRRVRPPALDEAQLLSAQLESLGPDPLYLSALRAAPLPEAAR
jgi:hypothetical protein